VPPLPAAAPEYVELRCRSAFSFLEAASNPEDLAARAAELGYGALALADRDGISAAPRFFQAARAAGLHPIVGADVSLAPPAARTTPGSLLLLVESQSGYRNLCRLLTLGHARCVKGSSLVHWDELEAFSSGLIALARGDAGLTPALVARARGGFGPGRFFVDVSRHLSREAEAAARRAVAIAEAARVPIVATGDVRFAAPADRPLFDALTCLRHKTSLDRAGRLLACNAERHLRTAREMVARFADRPAWLRATLEIAERCAFSLADLGYRFPEFPVPPGETQTSWLRRLTEAGARERYGSPVPARARAQLDHELRVIEKLDLAGYFLIVHDITCFAKQQQILVQGRGSAANSAVCYALGITAVDPVAMGLLFERFLSEERGEWPDIDLDLPSGDQREKVIQHVFGKYGAAGAAMTAVVVSWRSRLAVREMGKVLGLAPDALDRLSRVISGLEHRDDLEQVSDTLRQAGVDPSAPRIAQLLELSARVQGLPRHLGQHTGGIVIAAGRLDEVVPIEPAAMPDRRVVQWDKDDCADLGIIKIDLLGLGMLDALEQALPLVHEHEGVEIDLAHLPPDDPETYAMIRRADTIGVFQIESRAQMATLPRMKPERFYDLVVEVAIIRPGPITGQMVHPYLNRRAGREPVVYPHPSLEPILARTLGVPLFQEQLLRIAMTAAGFSGGEAEELRRAMGFKRSQDKMQRLSQRLRVGMTERGITGAAQEEILRGVVCFALYGFPESHAASFALIAYASAYLKCHHPAAFLAGLLNAWPMGFYAPATLVKDAQRHGVEVRAIDVAHSDWKCTLEPASRARSEPKASGGGGAGHAGAVPARPASQARSEPKASGGGGAGHAGAVPARPASQARSEPKASGGGGAGYAGAVPARPGPRPQPAVRLGLRFASGLREQAGNAIASERGRRPFSDLADLVRRVSLRRSELETLAELGALARIDSRARTRRSALWQVAGLERDSHSLFAGLAPDDGESPLAEMTPLEDTLADYRRSGLTAGPQVISHLRAELDARGVLPTAALRDAPNGRVVRTAGQVIVRQRPETAKGFVFLTLEDETGTANAILTPQVFRRFRVPLHSAAILEIEGPVQNLDDVIHVRVRSLRALAPREGLPGSHDYR
jgi:error-prone DNA polymerase